MMRPKRESLSRNCRPIGNVPGAAHRNPILLLRRRRRLQRPSAAISLIPADYPEQQPKTASVVSALNAQAQKKSSTEKAASQIAAMVAGSGLGYLLEAMARSERLVTEDIMREAGYMLPQSANVRQLLEDLVANPPTSSFPIETAKQLLKLFFNKGF